MDGQISLFEGANKFKIDKPIRLLEFFGGIGSQAKALENLGIPFEHYRMVEIDKYAVKSYNAIHGTSFATSDITKITGKDLGITETDKYCYILTYSFPCTDLSTAGKQMGMKRGSGTRSGLLWEVERLLRETKELPQVLVMENVPQVVGKKNIADFAQWISFLDGLGYKSKWQILNAKDYSIPQNRARCFMVSILGDYFYNFPKAMPLNIRLKHVLERNVDERYFVSDKGVEYIKKRLGKYTQIYPQDSNDIAKLAITAKGNTNWTGDFIECTPEISNSIRVGGRSSYDRHTWDLIGIYSPPAERQETEQKQTAFYSDNPLNFKEGH